MNLIFISSRLWRYLNIYFLKPFDAINDTLTSYLLYKDEAWQNDYIEIGSGDGMFSFIMHGGSFPLKFDRFIDVDISKKDIFDIHKKKILTKNNNNLRIRPQISVDANLNHVNKISEIGFSKKAIHSSLEDIPLENDKYDFIFFYTAHGLKNFSSSINEAHRILKKNGTLLILLFNSFVKKNFLCHAISKNSKGRISEYFKNLDNGRFHEISNYSKESSDWKLFFDEKGFKFDKEKSGLSGVAWKFYDIQTRPILKFLIKFFNFCSPNLRTLIKLFWMIIIFPFLWVFFFLSSNTIFKSKKNCYLVLKLLKK